MTSFDFYMMTPLEFDCALRDYEDTSLFTVKTICETLRELAKIVHNATPFLKKEYRIKDSKKLIKFSWERPKVQTVEQMKSFVLGMTHMSGVTVTQKGKPVKFE